jgi:hypothetical protein
VRNEDAQDRAPFELERRVIGDNVPTHLTEVARETGAGLCERPPTAVPRRRCKPDRVRRRTNYVNASAYPAGEVEDRDGVTHAANMSQCPSVVESGAGELRPFTVTYALCDAHGTRAH